MTSKTRFEIIGPCLARQVREGVDESGKHFRYEGKKIYARVRDNRKLTWKSTETDNASDARKWLRKWKRDHWLIRNGIEPEGVVLQRGRVTVRELATEYETAGYPRKTKGRKLPRTIYNERRHLRPLLAYFGEHPAASVTNADCDRYHAWRKSGGYVVTYKLRGHERTKRTTGGDRAVDLELGVFGNVLRFAVRRDLLKSNPMRDRTTYTSAADVRHCREVAPTPEGLQAIIGWLRRRNEIAIADLVAFLAYSGLRIGEALPLRWGMVNLAEGLVNVIREKKGVTPWVAITPELEALLSAMQERATSPLLFASPFDPSKPRDAAAVRHRLTAACRKLKIGHVTPHGLRSFYVTQARESGLTDSEIAALLGDKSGPALIAHTYGDVRPDHLLAQARRIRLTVTGKAVEVDAKASHTALPVTG
jgi:integrase